jgi:hypothetical protein
MPSRRTIQTVDARALFHIRLSSQLGARARVSSE